MARAWSVYGPSELGEGNGEPGLIIAHETEHTTFRKGDTAMTAGAPMKTDARERKGGAPKTLPAPNSDFSQLPDTLDDEERALLTRVRAFMETKVAPVINKYWSED